VAIGKVEDHFSGLQIPYANLKEEEIEPHINVVVDLLKRYQSEF